MQIILLFFCYYLKNHKNLLFKKKNNHLLSFPISVSWELGSGLAGQFWLGTLVRLFKWMCLRLDGPLLKEFTHIATSWYWQMVSYPCWSLHRAAWVSLWLIHHVSDPRGQDWNYNAFYEWLLFKEPHTITSAILLVTKGNLVKCGSSFKKDVDWEQSWILVTTYT
jgi:hypothetical protein